MSQQWAFRWCNYYFHSSQTKHGGLDLEISNSKEPEGHEKYDGKIAVHRRQWSGPCPFSCKESSKKTRKKRFSASCLRSHPRRGSHSKPLAKGRSGMRIKLLWLRSCVLKTMKLYPGDQPTREGALAGRVIYGACWEACEMVFEGEVAADAAIA